MNGIGDLYERALYDVQLAVVVKSDVHVHVRLIDGCILNVEWQLEGRPNSCNLNKTCTIVHKLEGRPNSCNLNMTCTIVHKLEGRPNSCNLNMTYINLTCYLRWMLNLKLTYLSFSRIFTWNGDQCNNNNKWIFDIAPTKYKTNSEALAMHINKTMTCVLRHMRENSVLMNQMGVCETYCLGQKSVIL